MMKIPGIALLRVHFSLKTQEDIDNTMSARVSRVQGGPRHYVNDGTALTIGTDVVVRAEHLNALNVTKTKSSQTQTRRGHRRRIKRIIDWWMTEYPDYYEVGTSVLSQEEKADPMRFHFEFCVRDIEYNGLRVDLVLAFMAANKKKPGTDIYYSITHMRKWYDAILFGARTVDVELPWEFAHGMDNFIGSYRKEHAEASNEGKVDEKSADPISFSLYRMLLKWAIERGNIFVWVWTILQWNLMARSISIDPLALHNITISEDHFVFRHDSTKSDKEGAKIHNKAVYCNPLDPLLCPGVSLGIWLSLNQNAFRDNSERLFLRRGARIGSAGHRYCEQLHAIVKEYWDIVQTFLTTFSAHGIRKGSATHVSCATTVPPPIASIANRGDWSLGKVLDVYWQFAEVGDNYLGRCLCGLDANLSTFSVLPPHWTVENPVDDPDINDALHLMYGVIIEKHPGSIAVLVRVLASVTYASDWLLAMSGRYPGHPLSAVPLMQNPELLSRLKEKVTIESTDSLSTATGVPPHVSQLNLMTSLLQLCQTTLLRVTESATTVRETIFEAMELRAIENGQITRQQIVGLLDEFRNGIRDDVRTQIELIQAVPGLNATAAGGAVAAPNHRQGTLYTYNGRFWDVPPTFQFPSSVKRDVGWRLWLQGMPAYATVCENGLIENNKIKQFRNFLPARLPANVRGAYKLHWRPLFGMMEKGVGNIPAVLTTEIVNNLYELGTEYLKTRVSYVFANEKHNHNDWTIATWAKYLNRSMILKNGTDLDKQLLPPATYLNRPRTVGLKRRRGADAAAIRQEQNVGRQSRQGPHSAINAPPADEDTSNTSEE